ncbi:MAG: TetR/AcrR family transcriptional regulator [Chloroflexia bacterium]|nr:TetR/AcrR family transcriptional regulator [Chloroflexia bacterium]
MEQSESGGTRRRRSAVETRAAILAAARYAFTKKGYDQVGVRDIASHVGVDPALVIRYFGSKEGLFAESVAQKFDISPVFAGDRSGLGDRLARSVLAKKPGGEEFDPMLALLRSAPSDAPGRLLRVAVDDDFVQPLAALIGGANAELRAGLIGSILLGLLVGRSVVKMAALSEAASEDLVAAVAPVLQRYVDDA